MKIQSLEINNFKVFDKQFDKIENIRDAGLILFNGPNGYGKTSVFDAIELALTGKIKRLQSYNEELKVSKMERYNRMILVADPSQKAWIKLTLCSGQQEMVIISEYVPQEQGGIQKASKDNNPQFAFDKFERTLVVDGKEYCGDKEIQQQFEKYGMDDLENYFTRCCFLSQDENLSFLKKAGKDKVEGLNFLFDLTEEERQKEKIDKLLDRLQNKNIKNNLGYLQILRNRVTELKEKILQLDGIVKDATSQGGEQCVYERLFYEREYYWDREIIEVNQQTYEAGKKTLQELLYFSEHQEECLRFAFNKPYLDLIKPYSGLKTIRYDKNQLEYGFRYYSFIKNGDNIETQYLSQKKYQEIEDYLKRKEVDKINYEFLLSESLIQEDVLEEIKKYIERIVTIEKRQNGISTVISSIQESREVLLQQMEDAIENQYIDDKKCPLCGNPFDEKKKMKAAMDAEKEILNALCDDATKEKDAIVTELYKMYLKDIEENVRLKLQNVISEEIYNTFLEVKKKEANILEMKEQLEKINVSLPDKYITDEKELEQAYQEFVRNIESRLEPIAQEVSQELKKYDWCSKYEYYYGNDRDKFFSITDDRLKNKIKYFENQYINANIKQMDSLKQERDLTQNRYKVLENIYSKLKKYSKSVEEGINAFKKKVVEDVEPLLYVYTAKIMQQKFNGRSIMLQIDDDFKQIRFVNSTEDTQDILYSMSSGQLAAVSISFLLCMNQVYARDKFPVLMIDDPVQTIDDVNMVGLVDILRYEFADSQIFMSTHEQNFEWYLRYKYEKTGKNMKLYNMKKLLLENVD